MNEGSLAGAGVLQTRPEHQSAELDAEIRAAGGRVLSFPVMDIVPRAAADVAAQCGEAAPDIVVFVSPNAVRFGLDSAPPGAVLAAIGSATAEALARAGREPAIVPAAGYDSEALLAEAALADVDGRRVRIVRGDGGRELLGETLAARGATVEFVEVYARRKHAASAGELATVDAAFAGRQVDFVIAMSVASLGFLLELLPPRSRRALPGARLVTPSSRVIQTAQVEIPGMTARQAAGPRPEDLVATMLAWADNGRPNG